METKIHRRQLNQIDIILHVALWLNSNQVVIQVIFGKVPSFGIVKGIVDNSHWVSLVVLAKVCETFTHFIDIDEAVLFLLSWRGLYRINHLKQFVKGDAHLIAMDALQQRLHLKSKECTTDAVQRVLRKDLIENLLCRKALNTFKRSLPSTPIHFPTVVLAHHTLARYHEIPTLINSGFSALSKSDMFSMFEHWLFKARLLDTLLSVLFIKAMLLSPHWL